MAHTEHLPIYKAAYDLCLYFEGLVRGFSRYHKYSLGQDLRDGARRVLKLVVCGRIESDEVLITTAYQPDPDEWEPDWTTRKR